MAFGILVMALFLNQVVVQSGRNEHLDQRVQEGFTSFSHVMDKLKEAQV